jgi:hypothetical protein
MTIATSPSLIVKSVDGLNKNLLSDVLYIPNTINRL